MQETLKARLIEPIRERLDLFAQGSQPSCRRERTPRVVACRRLGFPSSSFAQTLWTSSFRPSDARLHRSSRA